MRWHQVDARLGQCGQGRTVMLSYNARPRGGGQSIRKAASAPLIARDTRDGSV